MAIRSSISSRPRRSDRQAAPPDHGPGQPHTYLSSSGTLVLPQRRYYDDPELSSLADIERQIITSQKLMEPEFLKKPIERRIAAATIKTEISNTEAEILALKRPLETMEGLAMDFVDAGLGSGAGDGSGDDEASNEGSDELKSIDLTIREIIEDMQILEYRKKVLCNLLDLISSAASRDSSVTVDLHSHFCSQLAEQIQQWDSISLKRKFGCQRQYHDFRAHLWKACGNSGIMPSLKNTLAAETGEDDGDSSDDELEVAGGTQSYKCPLCLKYLTEPLASQLCKHHFCRACFESYLQGAPSGKAGCPNAGCDKTLSSSTVVPDETLGRRAKQLKRQMARRLEEGGDDDGSPPGGSPPVERAAADDKEGVDPSQRIEATPSGRPHRRKRVVVDDDE